MNFGSLSIINGIVASIISIIVAIAAAIIIR